MTHYLKKYARFTNTAEMDAAAEQHLLLHWDELTKSDRQVLDVIRRYSVKYGAAHLKHGTIEDATGRSNVTVRRAIRKLVNTRHHRKGPLHPPSNERTRRQHLHHFTVR